METFLYWILAGCGLSIGFFVTGLLLEALYDKIWWYFKMRAQRERSSNERG